VPEEREAPRATIKRSFNVFHAMFSKAQNFFPIRVVTDGGYLERRLGRLT
jgi:hypothetical protein